MVEEFASRIPPAIHRESQNLVVKRGEGAMVDRIRDRITLVVTTNGKLRGTGDKTCSFQTSWESLFQSFNPAREIGFRLFRVVKIIIFPFQTDLSWTNLYNPIDLIPQIRETHLPRRIAKDVTRIVDETRTNKLINSLFSRSIFVLYELSHWEKIFLNFSTEFCLLGDRLWNDLSSKSNRKKVTSFRYTELTVPWRSKRGTKNETRQRSSRVQWRSIRT